MLLVIYLHEGDGQEYEIDAEFFFLNWKGGSFEIYTTSIKIEEARWSGRK